MKLTRAIYSDIPELVELLVSLFEQEAEFEPNSEAQRKALRKMIVFIALYITRQINFRT